MANRQRFRIAELDIKRMSDHFRFLGRIASGTFGEVLYVVNNHTQKIGAVKIVKCSDTSPEELSIWPQLEHPNILQVINVESFEQFNLFFTKQHPFNLPQVINKHFGGKRRQFCQVLEWGLDILKGLKYLHGSDLCHLDLKANNILMSQDDEAIICDFSTIARTGAPTKRYGLPAILRPPDAWPQPDRGGTCRRPLVNGKAFDVWSVGVLIFQMIFRKWPSSTNDHNWWNNVYPFVFTQLQTDKLEAALKRLFPGTEVNADTRRKVQNLLRGILRLQPEKRPTVEDIINHPLFNPTGTGQTFEEDCIWTRHEGVLGYKVSPKLGDLSKDFQLNARTLHQTKKEVNKILRGAIREMKIKEEKALEQEISEEQQLTRGKKIRNWFRSTWKSFKSCSCFKANKD